MTQKLIPGKEVRVETRAGNSRFITTVAPAFSLAEAKEFIRRIKAEFADATHNVPAFLIGHPPSVTAHCTDDGEPSGTAGRPMLAVLKGSGLGDVVVVVTRYYGGSKLGTGGLVRAYSEGVRTVLAATPRAQRVPTYGVCLVLPYTHFERLKKLIGVHGGQVVDEVFSAEITLTITFPVSTFPAFQTALRNLSHGTLAAEIIETSEAIVPV